MEKSNSVNVPTESKVSLSISAAIALEGEQKCLIGTKFPPDVGGEKHAISILTISGLFGILSHVERRFIGTDCGADRELDKQWIP